MFSRYRNYEANTITINTNKNCNLKCSYCYEHKIFSIEEDKKFWEQTRFKDRIYPEINVNNCKKFIIDIDTCKQFIDQIFLTDYSKVNNLEMFDAEKIVFDFIGGDSLQYPDLLEEIFNYIIKEVYNTKYRYKWKFQISSNGVSLLNKKTQKFCEKWRDNLSVGLSIDGCPELHDLNRKTFSKNIDGYDGSFKYIRYIWDWYRRTFPNVSETTKWTLVPNSYGFLYQSIQFLYEKLNIKYIHFNRAMEQDVIDTYNDIEILMKEFEKVNEYLLKNHMNLYLSPYDIARIDSNLSLSDIQNDEKYKTWSRCGFGQMPAVDINGDVYPCFRMIPGYSTRDTSNCKQGNINDIILCKDKLSNLYENSLAINLDVEEKCKSCPLFDSCPHCAADCVDETTGKVHKNTSVCNYHIIETLSVMQYWQEVNKKYRYIYKKYNIDEKVLKEKMSDLTLRLANNISNIKKGE
jgi:uncharacterized protein